MKGIKMSNFDLKNVSRMIDVSTVRTDITMDEVMR